MRIQRKSKLKHTEEKNNRTTRHGQIYQRICNWSHHKSKENMENKIYLKRQWPVISQN